MDFEEDLNAVLPVDLPHRDQVVTKGALHLRLIAEANASMNLTRITSPREAAIKHVLDSVIPWRLFADSGEVLDAGTGAGYPGIPLALVLPEARFTLSDSTGKKARFVASAAVALDMKNVAVSTERAEDLCRARKFEVTAARAVAPLSRLIGWLSPSLRGGGTALLYKGPDADREIAEARGELQKFRVQAGVAMRYELPEGQGSRTIVRLTSP